MEQKIEDAIFEAIAQTNGAILLLPLIPVAVAIGIALHKWVLPS